MSEKRKAIVILNSFSHGGTARTRWDSIRPIIENEYEVIIIETESGWTSKLFEFIDAGVRVLIAAGGDGTVHEVINALIVKPKKIPMEEFTLGAIGLGSSNDFHKPYQRKENGIPLKIDYEKRKLRDLVEVTIEDAKGETTKRLFIVSSSIGFVAEANHFFNTGSGLMSYLKRKSTGMAIPYAAVKTIFTSKNVDVEFSYDQKKWPSHLTSFHVMKTQYVAGSFRFDTKVSSSDRRLAVHLMEDLSFSEKLQAVVDLSSGRFFTNYHGKKRKFWDATDWQVRSKNPLPLELDGELYEFKKVSFQIYPHSIYECM